jgi:hypothetical protein
MGEWAQMVVRHDTRSLLAAGAVLVGLSCGGEGIEPPTSGNLEVTTVTSGPEPDGDGYSVTIDDGPDTPLGANATLQHDDLDPGTHSVRLTGIAANCAVTGDNPRSISILAGETTTVSFQLTCSATTGGLQITAATSGPSPDSDGYTIIVDGSDRGTLEVSGAATLDGLTPGTHAVGLSGIAANCQVQGDNPRSITVTIGASATAAFAIICAPPPAIAGTIRITTSTSGADLDADGYAFAVNGGTTQPIGISTTASLASVAAGAHIVRLSGLAGNCSVQGTNPRSVTVAAGATAEVSFSVTCTATTGSLTITTTTTGTSPDPDGYTVSVDGGTVRPIGIDATLSVPSLASGTHTVTLAGLAGNCAVQGDNPRTVTIVAGASATAVLTISCSTPGVKRWTSIPSGTTMSLSRVSGSSATNVFVVDQSGTIWHYDGSTWSLQSVPSTIRAVWANSANDAFAVGRGRPGTLLHYDGQQWSPMVPPPAPPNLEEYDLTIEAVWGSSGTDVFAVGHWSVDFDFGGDVIAYIAHYDGTAWSLSADRGNHTPSAIWGSSANNVYAIAQFFESDIDVHNSDILHFDGDTWSLPVSELALELRHIWGSSASDVYVTGQTNNYTGDNTGVLWHFDGTSWSTLASPTTEPLGPIWGSSATDIFMISGRHRIWHFDGATWKNVHTSSEVVNDIWGSSSTDVYVVGDNGTILHGTP